MKIQISPRYTAYESFIRSLIHPDFFSQNGKILQAGRNTIKLFHIEDQLFVVKRYEHLTLFNKFIYGILRQSKAERAYRHAIRLRQFGIGTPEEVAFLEIRRYGVLQASYFVSLYSDYLPLWPVAEQYSQNPELSPVLDALAKFLFSMHSAGVLHKDLNIGNLLYKCSDHDQYHFQVIDTNRMQFRKKLSTRRRLDNMRRLSCPVPAYLYILDQYAHLIQSDTATVQLEGAVMRLFFEMRQRTKQIIKSLIKKRPNN